MGFIVLTSVPQCDTLYILVNVILSFDPADSCQAFMSDNMYEKKSKPYFDLSCASSWRIMWFAQMQVIQTILFFPVSIVDMSILSVSHNYDYITTGS